MISVSYFRVDYSDSMNKMGVKEVVNDPSLVEQCEMEVDDSTKTRNPQSPQRRNRPGTAVEVLS